MTRSRYWKFIFTAFIIATFSCKEPKKEVESVPETVIESNELDNYSEKFKKLVVTDEGILRGFTFITDSSEIKKNENAEPLSSTPDELSYTIELNELELGDIYYHLKGNEVDTFELDLYLKNKESTDSLLNDFKNFYGHKFGQSHAKGDSVFLWTDSLTNAEVMLKYINKDVDHGINIYIYRKEEDPKVQ